MAFFCWGRRFEKYKKLIYGRTVARKNPNYNEIDLWKDRLFVEFLVYCLPVSVLAAVPGIFMAITDHMIMVAFVDVLCVTAISIITFCKRISIQFKKILIIGMFYALSLILVAKLGYTGPGIFYLLFITVLSALILPFRFALLSIVSNLIILVMFAIVIECKLFSSPLIRAYSIGQWIAFGSNIIFISTVLVVLIHRIFNGLLQTIVKKKELHEKYHNIFEHSPLPMWLFDIETLRFLDVNSAAVTHYGYSRGEFLAMDLKQIRPSGDSELIEKIVRDNKNEPKFCTADIIHRKKNGEEINVRIESSILNFNGRSAKLVLVNDITERRRAESEVQLSNFKLQVSELNLSAILNSSLDGYVLLDKECFIRAFNAKAAKSAMFNKGLVEFEIGRSVFDYLHMHRISSFREHIEHVLAGKTIEFDVKYECDGLIRWIHYTLTPVADNSSINGVCISGRDVTLLKSHMEKIESQNKVFREISWQQSHEVRAPLARIMGLLYLLNSETDKTQTASLISYLETSCKELDDIIRKITHQSNYNTAFDLAHSYS